jgi:hypothetical protein
MPVLQEQKLAMAAWHSAMVLSSAWIWSLTFLLPLSRPDGVTSALCLLLCPGMDGMQKMQEHFSARCKHPVKSCQIHPWLGDQSSQSGYRRSCASLRPRHTVLPVHKIQRFEDHMGGAIAERSLQLVAQLTGRGE